MAWRDIVLLVAGVGLAASQSSIAADERDTKTPWNVVTVGPANIAIPKRWRSLDKIKPTMPVYRQGDGIGVPRLDETQSPLQIGLTVEKFPVARESIKTIAQELAKGAKRNPRLEVVGKESIEVVKLSDQTEAALLTAEFIKQRTRRSLQIKLIAKDGDGTIWIVTGFVVGGKESTWPTSKSKLAKWLRAHVVSLTFGEAGVDEKQLKSAYKRRGDGQ